MYGVEIVELCGMYMFAQRKDPIFMRETIKEVKEDINRIIESYSGNLQASFALRRDLSLYINNYLTRKGFFDLFDYRLKKERKGMGPEFFVAEVRFIYEREEE
jgi:hypothetical protein